MSNVYLVMNSEGASRFIVCANNTQRAYELAKEKSNKQNEVFDRSFLIGKSEHNNEMVVREITNN